MPRYKKKALLVTVEKADIKQYITTLEGVTEANVGDYIVTGVDNEQWALKPKWFKLAYTHIKDNIWQRKPQTLTAIQIDEPEVMPTPNGDIKGDKGDYKVTGTKGEQWYVKPDIFDKTYEKVGKSMLYELQNNNRMLNKGHTGESSGIQKAIDQLGIEAVLKSIAPSAGLGFCDVHGHYMLPARTVHLGTDKGAIETEVAGCKLCPPNLANGTSATEVELVIDLDPDKNLGTNPQQKKTSYEEDVRGNMKVIPPTIMP